MRRSFMVVEGFVISTENLTIHVQSSSNVLRWSFFLCSSCISCGDLIAIRSLASIPWIYSITSENDFPPVLYLSLSLTLTLGYWISRQKREADVERKKNSNIPHMKN